MLNNNSNSYTPNRKVVTYVRTAAYDGAGDVINKQLTKLREFADKNNVCIVKEYIDNGFSGITHDRPAFMQMIEDAKNNPEWDTILICDIARFSRNVGLALEYLDYLNNHKIQLVTTTGVCRLVTDFDICKPIIDTINSSIRNAQRLSKKHKEVVAHE